MAAHDLGPEEAAFYELFSVLRREAAGLSVDLVSSVRLGIVREEEVHERLQRPDPVEVISDHLARVVQTLTRLLTSEGPAEGEAREVEPPSQGGDDASDEDKTQ